MGEESMRFMFVKANKDNKISKVSDVYISHIPRNINFSAHELANFGRTNEFSSFCNASEIGLLPNPLAKFSNKEFLLSALKKRLIRTLEVTLGIWFHLTLSNISLGKVQSL